MLALQNRRNRAVPGDLALLKQPWTLDRPGLGSMTAWGNSQFALLGMPGAHDESGTQTVTSLASGDVSIGGL